MNGKLPTYTWFLQLYHTFCDIVTIPVADPPSCKQYIPTQASLHSMKRFGRPSKDHSITQEATFETCLLPILTSGFLYFYSFCRLCITHMLIIHMTTMIIKCRCTTLLGLLTKTLSGNNRQVYHKAMHLQCLRPYSIINCMHQI